jgi:hypothetical protein
MFSAVLRRTGRKDWHKEGFAHGEGIGGGTPHQPEVDPAGLSQGGDPRAVAGPHGAVRSRKSSTGDGTERKKPHASSQRQLDTEADVEKSGTGATGRVGLVGRAEGEKSATSGKRAMA